MDGVRFIGMFVQIDDHDNRILPMIMNQTEKTSIDRCRLSSRMWLQDSLQEC